MSEDQIFPVSDAIAKASLCTNDQYLEMYKKSVDDPAAFWGEHGKRIDWNKPYSTVKNVSYDYGNVSIKWYEDGTLNASVNCIDRHLEKRGDQVAIIWEGDDPKDDAKVTYKELHENVCRLANAMKARGIKKGDVVTIYMPMVSKPPMPCWPARASARSIPSCSAGSRPKRWRSGSRTAARPA